MGRPNLYDLRLDFVRTIRSATPPNFVFGIRTVTQHRDRRRLRRPGHRRQLLSDRSTARTSWCAGPPTRLTCSSSHDPDRDTAILRYAKDLGLNMLRLEAKISSSEHLVEKADELGIPLMSGWMCCNQWEKWEQWDDEDHRVAQESLRSQIGMLRSTRRCSSGPMAATGCPPPDMLRRLPPHPDRLALAERHRRHRVRR